MVLCLLLDAISRQTDGTLFMGEVFGSKCREASEESKLFGFNDGPLGDRCNGPRLWLRDEDLLNEVEDEFHRSKVEPDLPRCSRRL